MCQRSRKVKIPTAIVTKLITCALLVLSLTGTVLAKSAQVRIEWIRSCTKKNGDDIGYFKVGNSTVFKMKNHGALQADVRILKDMAPVLPTDMTISRCSSSSARDCAVLLKYRERDLCVFFHPKNMLSGEFVDKFVPHLVCPLKEGGYHQIQNSTFGEGKAAGYFQAVPGELGKVTYVVGKAFSKVGNEIMMCAEMMFRILKS